MGADDVRNETHKVLMHLVYNADNFIMLQEAISLDGINLQPTSAGVLA